jgi:hypothetical protein
VVVLPFCYDHQLPALGSWRSSLLAVGNGSFAAVILGGYALAHLIAFSLSESARDLLFY